LVGEARSAGTRGGARGGEAGLPIKDEVRDGGREPSVHPTVYKPSSTPCDETSSVVYTHHPPPSSIIYTPLLECEMLVTELVHAKKRHKGIQNMCITLSHLMPMPGLAHFWNHGHDRAVECMQSCSERQ
jgi:hypothetical protein